MIKGKSSVGSSKKLFQNRPFGHTAIDIQKPLNFGTFYKS